MSVERLDQFSLLTHETDFKTQSVISEYPFPIGIWNETKMKYLSVLDLSISLSDRHGRERNNSNTKYLFQIPEICTFTHYYSFSISSMNREKWVTCIWSLLNVILHFTRFTRFEILTFKLFAQNFTKIKMK